MVWNPTPEVAVARKAAERLRAPICVVVYVTRDQKLGVASYGETKALCQQARKLAEHLFKAVEHWD